MQFTSKTPWHAVDRIRLIMSSRISASYGVPTKNYTPFNFNICLDYCIIIGNLDKIIMPSVSDDSKHKIDKSSASCCKLYLFRIIKLQAAGKIS